MGQTGASGTQPGSGRATAPVDDATRPGHGRRPPERVRTRRGDSARIGRFRVLRELGRGAMGVVFAAYDETLDRRVAVKVLLGNVRGSDRTRVEREARSMAKLTHPNVVQVYEVGDDDGELFIAMEYVEGTTLDRWLSASSRSWPEVLEVYRRAGEGLAAAHAVALVHRDFKPHNVMVQHAPGDDPVVKVFDFGLARHRDVALTPEEPTGEEPVGPRVTSHPKFTVASRVMGTPAYMAPEQFISADVEPAADQFSFCVALWEALYGERPFTGTSMEELVASVVSGERPAPPTAADVPTWLHVAVSRGLAIDPAERWPSMRDLLAALRPAPARPRRDWVVLAGGLATLGAVVAVMQGATRSSEAPCAGAADRLGAAWDDARRAEARAAFENTGLPYAARAWESTRRALDAYVTDWQRMYTETCSATTVRKEQSEAVMDLRMACLQRAQVGLDAVGRVFVTADAETVERAGDVVERLRPLWRCADVEGLRSDVEPPAPADADAVDGARGFLDQAQAQMEAGRFADAGHSLEQARAAVADIGYEPALTEILLREGDLLDFRGEFDGAAAKRKRAIELAAAHGQRDELTVAALELIAVLGVRQGKVDEAEGYVAFARGLVREHPEHEATFQSNLGALFQARGKLAEAEQAHRRALALLLEAPAPDEKKVAIAHSTLGAILRDRGHYEEAQAEHDEAVARLEQAMGPEHPSTVQALGELAITMAVRGDNAGAEREFRRVVARWEKVMGPEHPALGAAHNNLGMALERLGRLDEALAEIERGLEIRTAALGPDHSDVIGSLINVGSIHMNMGHVAEAKAAFEEALVKHRALPNPDPLLTANIHTNLSRAYWEEDDYEASEARARRSLEIRREHLGPDHPEVALCEANVATILSERGRDADALALAEAAWARVEHGDVPPEYRLGVATIASSILWNAGGEEARRRARTLRELAYAGYLASEGPASPRTIDAKDWLEAHELDPG